MFSDWRAHLLHLRQRASQVRGLVPPTNTLLCNFPCFVATSSALLRSSAPTAATPLSRAPLSSSPWVVVLSPSPPCHPLTSPPLTALSPCRRTPPRRVWK